MPARSRHRHAATERALTLTRDTYDLEKIPMTDSPTSWFCDCCQRSVPGRRTEHCHGTCKEDFSNTTAGDRHRKGGRCMTVAELEADPWFTRNRHGVWTRRREALTVGNLSDRERAAE
jgi:hypothetical protein